MLVFFAAAAVSIRAVVPTGVASNTVASVDRLRVELHRTREANAAMSDELSRLRAVVAAASAKTGVAGPEGVLGAAPAGFENPSAHQNGAGGPGLPAAVYRPPRSTGAVAEMMRRPVGAAASAAADGGAARRPETQ